MENIIIYTIIAFTLAVIFYPAKKQLNTYDKITRNGILNKLAIKEL